MRATATASALSSASRLSGRCTLLPHCVCELAPFFHTQGAAAEWSVDASTGGAQTHRERGPAQRSAVRVRSGVRRPVRCADRRDSGARRCYSRARIQCAQMRRAAQSHEGTRNDGQRSERHPHSPPKGRGLARFQWTAVASMLIKQGQNE